MANSKDYYEILSIPKNASAEDIKKAYRTLAREHHPDMVKDGDKASAETRFKEINEAYQVLSDPQKKQMYDQYGHAGPGFGGFGAGGQQGGFSGGQWGPFSYTYTSNGQGFEGVDPFDIFEEVFGFRGFGGGRRPQRGKNLYYELPIDFVDAVRGAEKIINAESGRVSVKIPAGSQNGTELRFPGKGMPGPNGAPAGDLFITLRVPTPPEFQRMGETLGVPAEIDFIQAVLGDVIEVPVVDPNFGTGIGSANLKIPAGTQPGTQFRLKGKGMPRLRGSGRGDVIVQVFVRIPSKLSKEQKRLLEEYQRL